MTRSPDTWSYKDWVRIEYRSAMPTPRPEVLLPRLTTHPNVLEIGCGAGSASLYLAAHGGDVVGFDVNPDAIRLARERAVAEELDDRTDFIVRDAIDPVRDYDFDAVVLIRVLTCFPEPTNWSRLLAAAYRALRVGGLLYVHDFVLDEANPVYRPRYANGRRYHDRWGNFTVEAPDGSQLCVAHHHDQAEIDRILSPYEPIVCRSHQGISMNGNELTMVELLAEKASSDYVWPVETAPRV